MADKMKTGWHGFSDWVAFIRASLSLAMMLGLFLWGVMVWALEDEFAPRSIVQDVQANKLLAQQAVDEIGTLQTAVTNIQLSIAADRLFDVKIASCAATGTSAKSFYAQRLSKMKEEYRKLNDGDEWIEPRCDELQ